MSEQLSYDLNRDMIKIIEEEFKASEVIEKFAEGLQTAGGADAYGKNFFSDYGKSWGNRVLELGETYSDQTYENLKKIAQKVKRVIFPHIPQRFIEIGYLATQPFEALDVKQNNHFAFIFSVDECAIFNSLKEKCGHEVTDLMFCKHACLSFNSTVYKAFDLEVELKMTASMPDDCFCRFEAVNLKPGN
ncbi:MAG: hypothetical protein KGZ79_12980 [Dethiobacter sp.]|nr:hypothetical protein [Dethiobacter sp.]